MPPRPRWPFQPLLLLGLAPALSLLYAAFDSSGFLDGVLSRDQTLGRDFVIFWSASVLLWRGDVATLFDPALFQSTMEQIMGMKLAFMPYPYPPNSVFFLAPFALLPLLAALPLWLGGSFAMIAALLRRIGIGWWLILALLLSPASIVNICTGQNGFFSAALLCGGLLLLDKRPVLAGILIGLLSYKPQLGLLIPFLLIAGGHWRCFVAASATVLLLAAGSVLWLGSDVWWLYLDASGPQHLRVLQYATGFFQQMSPTYFMAMRLLGLDLGFAWGVQIAAAIFAIGMSCWAFRQDVPPELKAALAMSATFLVSPYLLTYDMSVVAVAILVTPLCFRAAWWEQAIFALAWILPALALMINVPIGPLVLTALFLVLLRRVTLLCNTQDQSGPKVNQAGGHR